MGYSIVWEKQGAVCVYNGIPTLDELAAALTSVHQHIDFDQFRYAIHDFSGAADLHPGATDLSTLIAQALGASYTNPRIRTAIVAVHTNILHIAHQFAAGTGLENKIVASLQAARDWLHER